MKNTLLRGALLACSALPLTAAACECAKLTPAEIYAKSTIVFVGVLVDAHAPLPIDSDPSFKALVTPRDVEAHFFTHEMLKGTLGQVPAIVRLPGGSCGISAVVPAPYLIATDGKGRTSVCEGSHLIADRDPERDADVLALRKLREGKGP